LWCPATLAGDVARDRGGARPVIGVAVLRRRVPVRYDAGEINNNEKTSKAQQRQRLHCAQCFDARQRICDNASPTVRVRNSVKIIIAYRDTSCMEITLMMNYDDDDDDDDDDEHCPLAAI